MRTSLIALSLLMSTSAFAQNRAELPDELPVDESLIQYQAETEIEFGELDVTGKNHGPHIKIVDTRMKSATFPPIFNLRANFDSEMQASTNQVK